MNIQIDDIIKTISKNPTLVNTKDCSFLGIDYIDGIGTNTFGNKQHWKNGHLHREDGPAVECVNGNKYWYINGLYSKRELVASRVAIEGKYECFIYKS